MKKFIQFLVLFTSMVSLQAQNDGTIDLSFLGNNNGQKGANGTVYAFAEQSDGKILVSGAFDSYNQFEINKLVRINPDGSLDQAFNQTFIRSSNQPIRSVTIQDDGKIIVGGDFEVRTPFPENELIAQDIMRLNSDGSRDVSFIASGDISPCGDINDMVIQDDGKIILVGNITFCLGSTIDNNENILRLNTDGTIDPNYQVVVDGFNIEKALLQSDGKLIIAGIFNAVNGEAKEGLARLNTDGTLDNSFDVGTGFNDDVLSIALQTDGKLIVAGDFTEFNGTTQNSIVRLNTDGSIDSSFSSNTGPGRYFSSSDFTSHRAVETISLQDDGKIIIGGNFNRYDGVPISKVARLNSDGTLDTNFNNIDDEGTSVAPVIASFVTSNNKILTGGAFKNLKEYRKSSIAQLNFDGTMDLSFNQTFGPSEGYFATKINSIQPSHNDSYYVAGVFREYDDIFSRNIARLNLDGTLDTSFNTGIDRLNGFDDEVFGFMEQANGKIIVVGEFENYNQFPAPGIIRLNSDGTVDNTFNVGSGVDTANSDRINSIVELNSGKFLVGGFFNDFNGFTTRNLVRLNADGTVDATFSVTSTTQVFDIFPLENGQFYIPVFNYNGTTIAGRLARINADGTLDTTFNASGIINGSTEIVKVLDDNHLLVGGFYSSQGPLLKLNIDGSIDTSFSLTNIQSFTTTGIINDIELQADGKIIIGGKFDTIDGRVIRGLARLNSDGSLDETFNPVVPGEDVETYAGVNAGASTEVFDLHLEDSGRLLVAGNFGVYNNEFKTPLLAVFADIPPTLSDDTFDINPSVISVFPNPATHQFNMSSTVPIDSVHIVDVTGKLIQAVENIGLTEISFNSQSFTKGLYLLRINIQDRTIIKKLVIK